MPSTSFEHEVAVIGAGPYGLSAAAHLRAAGAETCLYGDPMSFWRNHMPRGMRLRSPTRASSIADPTNAFTLPAYAATRAEPIGEQLALETFVDYGRWFQRKAIAEVDTRLVAEISRVPIGFQVRLEDGTLQTTRRIVVATGLERQQMIPTVLAALPSELVSHSSMHSDLGIFRGKHVAVVGRGQSAVESAVLLKEAGARVDIISRGPIHWLGAASSRGALRRVYGHLSKAFAAPSAVGPFPLDWLAETPAFSRRLPHKSRDRLSERCVRPGASEWLLHRFEGIQKREGTNILAASARGDRIVVDFGHQTAPFDHVLLGTGYAIDIAKPGILSQDLLATIEKRGTSPVLSDCFETNIPGLHFVGASAVASFGPLLRFVAGAGFAGRAVTRKMRAGKSAKTAFVGKASAGSLA